MTAKKKPYEVASAGPAPAWLPDLIKVHAGVHAEFNDCGSPGQSGHTGSHDVIRRSISLCMNRNRRPPWGHSLSNGN
jgi:hypothetical protein